MNYSLKNLDLCYSYLSYEHGGATLATRNRNKDSKLHFYIEKNSRFINHFELINFSTSDLYEKHLQNDRNDGWYKKLYFWLVSKIRKSGKLKTLHFLTIKHFETQNYLIMKTFQKIQFFAYLRNIGTQNYYESRVASNFKFLL